LKYYSYVHLDAAFYSIVSLQKQMWHTDQSVCNCRGSDKWCVLFFRALDFIYRPFLWSCCGHEQSTRSWKALHKVF